MPSPAQPKSTTTSSGHPEAPTPSYGQTGVLLAISNAMVRLHKEQFGRGPATAYTRWAGDDVLVTVLEKTLTLAEQNMVKMGEHQRLRDTRMFFQQATVREFCEPVEQSTGRKIRSFMSAIDTEADGLVTEIFILHPAGYEGSSRLERAEP